MEITLKNGTVLDAVDVEESYYPRNKQGTVLSIRMNSERSVDELREMFTPEAIAEIQVGEGGGAETVVGYMYTGTLEYNTAVDLIKDSGTLRLTAEGIGEGKALRCTKSGNGTGAAQGGAEEVSGDE